MGLRLRIHFLSSLVWEVREYICGIYIVKFNQVTQVYNCFVFVDIALVIVLFTILPVLYEVQVLGDEEGSNPEFSTANDGTGKENLT